MARVPFYYQGREVAYMEFDMDTKSGDMYSTAGYSVSWIGRMYFDEDDGFFRVTNSRTGRLASFRVEDGELIFVKNYLGSRMSQDEFCVYIGVFDN